MSQERTVVESHFVTVRPSGVLTLPRALRRRHGLDRPGAQVEISEREDGVIELRAHVAVPADQAWFWTERWQAMEREVDEHVSAGRTHTFDDLDAFLGAFPASGRDAADR